VIDVDSTYRFELHDDLLFGVSPFGDLRFRWQPAMLAEKRDVRGRWRTSWPELRIIYPRQYEPPADPAMAANRTVLTAWRAKGPEDLFSIVEPFPSHQWGLLCFLSETQAARELASTNPVLAYALANSHELRGTHADAAAIQAVMHSRRKRRAIAAWLGFPEREAVVRFLGRLPPEQASPAVLRLVRSAICADPEVVDTLNHLPHVNKGVLELLAHPHVRPLVTPVLLREVLLCGEPALATAAADRLVRTLEVIETYGMPVTPRRFESLRQMREFADRVDERFNIVTQNQQRVAVGPPAVPRQRTEHHRRAKSPPKPFPPPPVPGTDTIQPITSAAALVKEGYVQHNCVGSLASGVRNGSCYYYRVLSPQRATAEIVLGWDGWRRGQLLLSGNRRPYLATIEAVDTWLSRHKVGRSGYGPVIRP